MALSSSSAAMSRPVRLKSYVDCISYVDYIAPEPASCRLRSLGKGGSAAFAERGCKLRQRWGPQRSPSPTPAELLSRPAQGREWAKRRCSAHQNRTTALGRPRPISPELEMAPCYPFPPIARCRPEVLLGPLGGRSRRVGTEIRCRPARPHWIPQPRVQPT